MEEQDKKEEFEKKEDFRPPEQELFSKAVRAGKRTYFFDVKSTRRGEYYLTLTESKKRFSKDGRFHFDKHKIFLYKEDFDKFVEGLEESIQYIKANQPEFIDQEFEKVNEDISIEKETENSES